MRPLALSSFCVVLGVGSVASAQEEGERDGPEWSWWLGAGLGYRHTYTGPVAEDGSVEVWSAGMEVTFRVATAGRASQYGGLYEWRAGPWSATSIGTACLLQEAGMLLSFTQTEHAQWGTFDVRAGGGYGQVDGAFVPNVVLTASGGVRSFWGRYGDRRDAMSTVPGFGSVLRVFGTTRLRPTSSSPWELTFGLEVEPTFLLPPYSWPRLGGARPH